jgi:hypothetical protein
MTMLCLAHANIYYYLQLYVLDFTLGAEGRKGVRSFGLFLTL